MRGVERFQVLMLVAALGLPACDDGDESTDGSDGSRASTILGLDADSTAGAEVYSSTCALSSCHGSTGDDGAAPGLSAIYPTLSQDQVVTVLLEGKNAMPPQSGKSDQELADVIAYLEVTFAN